MPSQSDWEESSEEESDEEPAPVPVAPPKKKGTLKAKLAEKEAEKAAKKNGATESDDYDSDAVLDPKEKARRDKERELKADLNNAADLLGAAALGGLSSLSVITCGLVLMLNCFDLFLLRNLIVRAGLFNILPTPYQRGLYQIL